jgi:CheY-like chemotaxis protein
MDNFIKNKKILVLEDDDINQFLLQNQLKCANIILTKSGNEALKVLEKETFDIILMDILMPYMNGVEFLKEFKKINKNIPIIVISAVKKCNVDGLDTSQIDGYLVKPITKIELLREIKKVLNL